MASVVEAPLAQRPAAVLLLALLAAVAFAPRGAVARECHVEETNSQGLAGLDDFAKACPPSCPVAVAPFGDICTALCVTNVSACSQVNRHATLEVGNVCKACSEFPEHIAAGASVCKTCHEDEEGRMTCDSCFKGFVLRDNSCVIESEEAVFEVVYMLCGIFVLFLVALVLVMVARKIQFLLRGLKHLWARFSFSWLFRRHEETREMLLGNEGENSEDESEGTDLEDEELEEEEALIARAVNHGKHFAMKSSISTNVKDGVIKGNMSDTIGLGIPLFFHTQFFLIVVSLVSLIMVHRVESNEWFQEMVTWINAAKDSKCNNFELAEIRHIAVMHGQAMSTMCFYLWVILMLMSWFFVAWTCFATMRHHDKARASFEDYTVQLEDVPRWVTSEDKLLQILQEKYPKIKDDIYGVSIVFNIKHVEEQLREKLDRLTEWDDAKYGWCGEAISSDMQMLQEGLKQDKIWLETFLKNGPDPDAPAAQKIEGSGTAFLIFKSQKAMQIALRTIRGIQIEDTLMPFFNRELPMQRVSSRNNRGDPRGLIDDNIVNVLPTQSEPPGICWYYFNIPTWRFALQVGGVYVGSVALFLAFAYVSRSFYDNFMKPYTDANVPPDQADAALNIAGNLVGVVNAVIQMVVQEMAKGAGFTKFSEMDRCVYRVNTVVVVLNFATQLFFFTWRGGFAMSLQASTNYDLTTEVGFGRNMLAFMVPNLLFVQYVLNEILTALLPTILNWLLLKMAYVWRCGPEGFRKMLVGSLPVPILRKEERLEQYPRLPGRVAEQALMFPELLLSLEYTFVTVYPMAAFSMLFFVTDAASTVFFWLTVFALIFYLWQRLVNFWMLRVTMHDSPDVWWGNVNFWGVPLSMVSTASAWWFFRVNTDLVERFHSMTLIMVLVFGFSYGIYLLGVYAIHDMYTHVVEGMDYENVRNKPFSQVMKEFDYNWWNTNPLYVLRHRHCPNFPGYECHKAVKCWADRAITKGFYESGKGFRLRKHPHHHHKGHSKSHLLTQRSMASSPTAGSP